MMELDLKNVRALLIDLDGVLWVGDHVLPGVAKFFSFLAAQRIPHLLVTNNATRRADYVVQQAAKMGIRVAPSQVLTSADAAPRWLKLRMSHLKRVFVIGETALLDALRDDGFELVNENADAVIVGMDRQLTYEKLKIATLQIRRGATFIATNRDRTLPTEQGLTPGAGSIVAALVAASDVEPIVIGKPGHPMFDLALEFTHTLPAETAMLGDRLDTDIDGAADMGLKTILVLTGVSTRAQAEQNRVIPDLIVADLPALQQIWLKSV